MMKKRKLLYLHGFNSSPESHKSQLLVAYMTAHGCIDALVSPQIPEVPGEAGKFLRQMVDETLIDQDLSVAGSSLGGYYATWLAETYNLPAVLINPSVKPYETLEACLGENKFYFSDKTWTFDESHIQQLRELDMPVIQHPENFLVLLQTGDETLDYRQAAEKFSHSQCIIEQGGEHAFAGFENHIQRLLNFCRIPCNK